MGEIRRCEGHKHRALFLTDEQLATMSYFISLADMGQPDGVLWLALRLTFAYIPNRGEARCNAIAFTEFHAGSEIDGQAADIAMRWLKQAGYSDISLPDLHRYVDQGKVA
jgi:hypothetical protein